MNGSETKLFIRILKYWYCVFVFHSKLDVGSSALDVRLLKAMNPERLFSLEEQRQAGDHQNDLVGQGGNPLIQAARMVAEFPA